jgi:hypothetical membrane protein
MSQHSTRPAGRLLTCGLIAGPLFMATSVVVGLTRAGFDLGHQPISFLTLGPLGWIQRLDFVVTGLLVLAFAAGLRRASTARSGRWAAAFAGGLGVGLVIAGAFPPDPGFGYPPGTPDGTPQHLTYRSALHGVGFTVAFVSFALLCAVSARRAATERRWPWLAYSALTAVAVLALGLSGGNAGIAVRDLVAAALLWSWVAVFASVRAPLKSLTAQ